MDRPSFSGDSENRQSTRGGYRTNPNPRDPPFRDLDRTLLDSFSGLTIEARIDHGTMLGSGFGGYGVLSPKREQIGGGIELRYFAPPPETWGFGDSRRCGLVDGSDLLKSDLYRRHLDWAWIEEAVGELCVEDLQGMIVGLSKNQNGCRVLQKLMEGMREKEIDMIFSEVIHHVCELMVHPFGNYAVQKLVEVIDEEKRNQMLLMVTQSKLGFVSLCLNVHGTLAMQKLMEKLTTKEQIALVMAVLSPCAVALTKDMNGHHIIVHCLNNFSDDDNKYLLNEVEKNCFEIATDKSGCFVLQQCVKDSRGEPRERLIAQIIVNTVVLAEDRYGNYVVQYLLGLKIPRITTNVLRKLQGKYLSLSCNKFGSNVVEKCLEESGEDGSAYVIMELLQHPNVSMLLIHPFGNFVIQSALKVSQGFVVKRIVHDALVDLIHTNYQVMRSNMYGKKILSRFDRKAQPK